MEVEEVGCVVQCVDDMPPLFDVLLLLDANGILLLPLVAPIRGE